MKRISITGFRGLIGSHLVKAGCIPLDCDVTDKDSIQRAIDSAQPEIIVHLAFKSSPEFCEKKENDKIVSAVNLRGSYNVFTEAEKCGIPVVFLSSDHVFGGSTFEYKENSRTNPVNQYGLSKLTVESLAQGFDNVKIVRSSTVFAYEWDRIQYYITQEFGKLTGRMDVPDHIWRNFIYINHFIDGFLHYIYNMDNMPKILHIAGNKSSSWYDFVVELSQVLGQGSAYIYPRINDGGRQYAPRPHQIKLNTDLAKKLGIPLYSWLEGIKQMHMDEVSL